GVRMTIPIELDRRFRDAAASEGLLDVAYDLADSPVGTLLVAATGRGLCRISFAPDEALDALTRGFGLRLPRVPRQLDPGRRRRERQPDRLRGRARPQGGAASTRGCPALESRRWASSKTRSRPPCRS